MAYRKVNGEVVAAFFCEGNPEHCQNLCYLYENDAGMVVTACPLHVDLAFAKAEERFRNDPTITGDVR